MTKFTTMKKILKCVFLLFVTFSITTINAQVLFTETFDTYSNGDLNANYDNTTVGQGGWVTGRGVNSIGKAIVTPETGKGKVLIVSSNNTTSGNNVSINKDIESLWNNRATGNNVLKFKYEYYGMDNFLSAVGVADKGFNPILMAINFNALVNQISALNVTNTNGNINISILKNNTTPFPYAICITSEMYIDFNTNKIYYYIPTLNILHTTTFTHNFQPIKLYLNTTGLNSQSVVKYDNIELSALQNLPTYILSTSEQLSLKFNLFPNPATNVVNLTNSENMSVNQVTIYNIAGKEIKKQTFNNEMNIQLNVEDLASGTYMLHVETEQGMAVKKLMKK